MMPVKAPDFWQTSGSWQEWALSPLAHFWTWGADLHQFFTIPQQLPIPVISVGNWTLGGGGKTPLALWLLHHLANSAVISRGYKGAFSQQQPVRVDPKIHTAQQVGDEALLLARKGPTWICQNRAKAAQSALASGAKIIILDDGHQNYYLRKTLNLVVIDGALGLGNERVFPSGPLRRPIETALKTTDAILMIGPDKTRVSRRLCKSIPLFHANLEPEILDLPKGRPIAAFAGIAYPQKFLRTLSDMGITPHPFLTYPDHYQFQKHDLEILQKIAQSQPVVTTEKDWVRLPDYLKNILIPIAVHLKPEPTFLPFIKQKISS